MVKHANRFSPKGSVNLFSNPSQPTATSNPAPNRSLYLAASHEKGVRDRSTATLSVATVLQQNEKLYASCMDRNASLRGTCILQKLSGGCKPPWPASPAPWRRCQGGQTSLHLEICVKICARTILALGQSYHPKFPCVRTNFTSNHKKI